MQTGKTRHDHFEIIENQSQNVHDAQSSRSHILRAIMTGYFFPPVCLQKVLKLREHDKTPVERASLGCLTPDEIGHVRKAFHIDYRQLMSSLNQTIVEAKRLSRHIIDSN
jgi:hypothetical protein